MDSIDVERLRRRARTRYEWTRAWRAVVGVSPAIVIVALACLGSPRSLSALVLGLSMLAFGTLLLWFGKDASRAVLPGFLAGLIPLACSLCANHMGHSCSRGGCVSWCMPACLLGGFAAGILVSVVARRQGNGLGFWLGASGLTLLTGAMGCACIGYSGVLGLAAGYGVAVVPALLRRPPVAH